MRSVTAVAAELLHCALAWAPDARLVGNVRADEVAALAARHMIVCPVCGAEAWVNIDCKVCMAVSSLSAEQNESPQAD